MYKLSNSTKENTKRLGDVAINKSKKYIFMTFVESLYGNEKIPLGL